jgi:hypothetical protein
LDIISAIEEINFDTLKVPAVLEMGVKNMNKVFLEAKSILRGGMDLRALSFLIITLSSCRVVDVRFPEK